MVLGALALAVMVLALGTTAGCSSSGTRMDGTDAAQDLGDRGPGDGPGPSDGGAPDAAEGALPFGATCGAPAECETGVCYLFGDGTMHCTRTCDDGGAGDDCPLGTQGRKCNGKGYCAY